MNISFNILSTTQKPITLTCAGDTFENLKWRSFEYRLALHMFLDTGVPTINIVDNNFSGSGYLFVDGSAMSESEILDWANKAEQNRFYLYVYNIGGVSI